MSRFLALTAVLLLSLAGMAHADDSRPFYVEIEELQNFGYRVSWVAPATLPAFNLPQILMPEDCRRAGAAGADLRPAYSGLAIYACDGALAGKEIEIRYPAFNPPVSSMIKLKTLKGEERIGLLSPRELIWTAPEGETKSSVARQYTKIGVEHILAGRDHLLFLVCLLWIAGDFRRVLITITGFTLSHSVTIALSALEIIRVPVPPVDAAIALSIVFLAREIVIGRRDSLTWNHPIAVSSSFGLLHGLGFAAVLGQIGLPQTELVTGLLFFNVGVEIGQLLFIAGVGVLYLAAKSLAARWREGRTGSDVILMAPVKLAAAYGVGIVSTYWLIDRVLQFQPG